MNTLMVHPRQDVVDGGCKEFDKGERVDTRHADLQDGECLFPELLFDLTLLAFLEDSKILLRLVGTSRGEGSLLWEKMFHATRGEVSNAFLHLLAVENGTDALFGTARVEDGRTNVVGVASPSSSLTISNELLQEFKRRFAEVCLVCSNHIQVT